MLHNATQLGDLLKDSWLHCGQNVGGEKGAQL